MTNSVPCYCDAVAHNRTEPGDVASVALTSVTSRSAELEWKGPSNVPAPVKRLYRIVVRNSGVHQIAESEYVVLNDLAPFHRYEVSIRTEAIYEEVPYLGEETFLNFTTDVGVPGVVRDLNVALSSSSLLLHVA